MGKKSARDRASTGMTPVKVQKESCECEPAHTHSATHACLPAACFMAWRLPETELLLREAARAEQLLTERGIRR